MILRGVWWRRDLLELHSPTTATALEEQLLNQLREAERQVRDLRLENEKLTGTIQVHELQIKQLAAVNERNQMRIESETAELAQRIALATTPVGTRQ
jgi:hypothetical protein